MTTCSEVMTKTLVCSLPTDTVEMVARMMRSEDIGPIPVVENRQTNKLLGIVTDRDLVLKILADGRDPKRTTVEEVMTRNPVVCHQEDNIVRALKSMGEYQVRRIPIVDDDNHIVGIIAQADVATRIGEPMKTAEVIKEISKSDSTEQSPHHVESLKS